MAFFCDPSLGSLEEAGRRRGTEEERGKGREGKRGRGKRGEGEEGMGGGGCFFSESLCFDCFLGLSSREGGCMRSCPLLWSAQHLL